MYLFWAISVGIVCGAGFAEYVILLSLVLTLVILVLSKLKEVSHPQILVVNGASSAVENDVLACVAKASKKYKVKSRNSNTSSYSMVVELSISENNTLVCDLEKIQGVHAVSLVSHDGEVTY